MSDDLQHRIGPVITEKRASQWEELMRKFSAAHKERCNAIPLDIPRAPRSIKQFPTGSTYEGMWDVLGMSGFGVYTFPNDVIYEGEFEDGMFHGEGELRYPSGAILKGQWKKGVMTERKLTFADGLEYTEENWKYCRMPDRRFTIEYEEGLQPAGQSFLTPTQPTRDIPPGYYDTEDGFYDPKTKVIYSPDDLTVIVRAPSTIEQKWIVENCRKSPDEPLGPRPELYEEWMEPQMSEPDLPPPAATSRATTFRGYSDEWDHDVNEIEETISRRISCGTIRAPNNERWHTRKVITFDPSLLSLETSSTSERNIPPFEPTIPAFEPTIPTVEPTIPTVEPTIPIFKPTSSEPSVASFEQTFANFVPIITSSESSY